MSCGFIVNNLNSKKEYDFGLIYFTFYLFIQSLRIWHIFGR